RTPAIAAPASAARSTKPSILMPLSIAPREIRKLPSYAKPHHILSVGGPKHALSLRRGALHDLSPETEDALMEAPFPLSRYVGSARQYCAISPAEVNQTVSERLCSRQCFRACRSGR